MVRLLGHPLRDSFTQTNLHILWLQTGSDVLTARDSCKYAHCTADYSLLQTAGGLVLPFDREKNRNEQPFLYMPLLIGLVTLCIWLPFAVLV